MIHWFDEPFAGRDGTDFEILIHGLVVVGTSLATELRVIVIDEDGQLAVVSPAEAKTNFRYDRKNRAWTMGQVSDND